MKKIIALLLTMIMLASIVVLGITTYGATSIATTQKTVAEIQNPVVENGTTIWDCVYFGNYYKDNATTKAPIKWRVLSINGSEALLFADKSVDMLPFCDRDENDKIPTNKLSWKNSEVRSFLNGYSGTENVLKMDFSDDNFIDNAFTQSEQDAILTSSVKEESLNNSASGTSEDKIYLLSKSDVYNSSYGFASSKSRSEYNTNAYVHAGGWKAEQLKKEGIDPSTVPGVGSGVSAKAGTSWWLRTIGQEYSQQYIYVSIVERGGSLYESGIYAASCCFSVRPALKVDLSKVEDLWSYAGVVNSQGLINEDGDRDNMHEEPEPTEPTEESTELTESTEETTEPIMVKGDANKDQKVTISDATTIQQYLSKLIGEEKIDLQAASVTGGQVSIMDATKIQQYLSNKIKEL